MFFSKSCEYAIRAAIYVAIKSRNESKLGIEEIAKEIDSPAHFTAKVLQTLTRNKIISSVKGPNGGFFISANAKPVPIIKIVKAVDGDDTFKTCILGLKMCSAEFPCPLHHQVADQKAMILEIFEKRTIQDLAKDITSGHYHLRNLPIQANDLKADD